MQESRRDQIASQRRHYQKIEKRINHTVDVLILSVILVIIIISAFI